MLKKNKVRFANPVVTAVYEVPNEERGEVWKAIALDGSRFEKRILDTSKILDSILKVHIKITEARMSAF